MKPDSALSDKEFDELDRFLMSDAVGDEGMTMDALHGYLTAIAIGPESVPQSEWLQNIWGLHGSEPPTFTSKQQAERITQLITRFMNEIVVTFEAAPKEFEPLFCVCKTNGKEMVDGETWAWGFWEGMQLRAKAWEAIHSSSIAPLLRPIFLLGANEISDADMQLVNTPEKCHKLALEVESAIPHIHQYWLRSCKQIR
jgi:uncharacterized protein